MSGDHFLNLQPGTVVNGRYEVVKCLGTGSMGMVYACRHRELAGHIVAMKVLFSEVARDEIAAARFRNEIVASYGVSHPNVVRAYEYFRDGDLIAYTMEYVSGGDLADKISNQEVIAIPEIVRMLTQMCSGVQAIHDAGIVHRDLKPENILLTTTGDIKITDFGIARMHSGPKLTDHGGVVGTIDYVSPEYLEQGQVDARSDIYALGVLAYEMITHEAPFKGKSVVESMTMRLRSDPNAPHLVREDCPKALSTIILKAMARDPHRRYQAAREMCDDLMVLQRNLESGEDLDAVEEVSQGREPSLDDIFSPSPEAMSRARADTAELQAENVVPVPPRPTSAAVRPEVFPGEEPLAVAYGGGGALAFDRNSTGGRRGSSRSNNVVDNSHGSGAEFPDGANSSTLSSSVARWEKESIHDAMVRPSVTVTDSPRQSIAVSESHLPTDRLRELSDNIHSRRGSILRALFQLIVIFAFGFGVGYFLLQNFDISKGEAGSSVVDAVTPGAGGGVGDASAQIGNPGSKQAK